MDLHSPGAYGQPVARHHAQRAGLTRRPRRMASLLVLAAWPLDRLLRAGAFVPQASRILSKKDSATTQGGQLSTRVRRASVHSKAEAPRELQGRLAHFRARGEVPVSASEFHGVPGTLPRSRRGGKIRLRSGSPESSADPGSSIVGDALSGLLSQLRLILVFICAQTGLNVYMKWMMSKVYVAGAVRGIPASFLVTGLQQLVALGLFIAFLILRRAFPEQLPQCPRMLEGRERLFIICLAATFAGNMSLNNFSLALIPLSINQVIRACMPLATAILQKVLRRKQDLSAREWWCMLAGVVCAALTVVAKVEGKLTASGDFVFGVGLCTISVFLGALDLTLKNAVRSELNLSPVDAMGYMACPAFLFLLLPAFLWQHPVPDGWATHLGSGARWTDAAVLATGLTLRSSLLLFIAISGVIAFGYNVITTFFAIRLSATTTSLVGNFPTSILVSLLILERTSPRGFWGVLMWASIFGNVAAFTAYNMAKQKRTLK